MAEVVTVGPDGTRWLRLGECGHCGQCCMGGDPSVNNPQFSDTDRAGQTVPGHCPLLRLSAAGSGCAGHGTHPFYLSGCHQFPTRPQDIENYPGCTYRFEAA